LFVIANARPCSGAHRCADSTRSRPLAESAVLIANDKGFDDLMCIAVYRRVSLVPCVSIVPLRRAVVVRAADRKLAAAM
jgi:hypothetical protein